MSYVKRDGEGRVVHVSEWPIAGVAVEKLEANAPDLIEFETRISPPIGPTPAETAADAVRAAKDFAELQTALAAYFDDVSGARVRG